jgi:hypothetical protein
MKSAKGQRHIYPKEQYRNYIHSKRVVKFKIINILKIITKHMACHASKILKEIIIGKKTKTILKYFETM